MSFLYPSFLVALAALLIPIIIHLFNFRRHKKVYFTNVKFLKEVKEETASRSRLKHWLVLLSRLLALAFLVLAFAQPFIPAENEKLEEGKKAVSIYVDNSFSMKARTDDVSLLEKAKQKATEIVESYPLETRFQLLTNDFLGKHQRIVDKDEFLNYLDEVQATPNVQKLSGVVQRQRQALEYANADHQHLFLVSDFQKSIMDLKPTEDTTYRLNIIPLQAPEQSNVFIDSAWFATPIRMLNQPNRLYVRLNNTGKSKVTDSRMTLLINGQKKALKDVNIEAQKTKIDTLNFTITESGWNKAEILLTDYPIEFDNTYFFTFQVAPEIKTLAINNTVPSPYLEALFKESSGNFNFTNQAAANVDYSNLNKNQLVILNGLRDLSSGLAYALQQYVNDGGSLLIFPQTGMQTASFNELLRTMGTNTYRELNYDTREVDYINRKHEVFRNVFTKIPNNMDMPQVYTAYDMSNISKAGEQTLLRLKGGRSLLGAYRYGRGKVYLSAASLNTKENNLAAHAIFVPMIHKIALVGGRNQQIAFTIGQDNLIEVENKKNSTEAVFKLKGEAEEFIPGQKVVGPNLLLSINNQLQEAGIYQLYKDVTKPLEFFGFNFNRRESVIDYFKQADLKTQLKAANTKFLNPDEAFSVNVGQNKKLDLWQWCLLAALLFLFIEIFLLRLWKTS